jgi:hypothetical protein
MPGNDDPHRSERGVTPQLATSNKGTKSLFSRRRRPKKLMLAALASLRRETLTDVSNRKVANPIGSADEA